MRSLIGEVSSQCRKRATRVGASALSSRRRKYSHSTPRASKRSRKDSRSRARGAEESRVEVELHEASRGLACRAVRQAEEEAQEEREERRRWWGSGAALLLLPLREEEEEEREGKGVARAWNPEVMWRRGSRPGHRQRDRQKACSCDRDMRRRDRKSSVGEEGPSTCRGRGGAGDKGRRVSWGMGRASSCLITPAGLLMIRGKRVETGMVQVCRPPHPPPE